MATRSTIAVEHDDGTISSITGHWDGYLSGVGRTLFNHYNSLELAEQLISYGNISQLGRFIVPTGPHSFDNPQKGCCVFYKRDRNESGQCPIRHASYISYKFDRCDEEYNYFFKDNEWYLLHHHHMYIKLSDIFNHPDDEHKKFKLY